MISVHKPIHDNSNVRGCDTPVDNLGKPFVVYWNNIPSPYMVERFNALADRNNFEFEAWFNDRTEPDRSWDVDESGWHFRYRYLPKTRLFEHTIHWPLPLFGRRPEILVSLYAEPSFLMGWMIAKLRKVRTVFWCEITRDSWVKRKVWKDAIKHALFTHVDATLGGGEESRAFAMRFGVSADRAMCLPHSIDVKHFMLGSLQAQNHCEILRTKLGLQGTTFIYVGRLWWGKGLLYLLEAFEKVQKQSTEPVSLLLVGDGPEETNLKQMVIDHDLRNVVFVGFKQKSDLPQYYALADVFVFPTLGDPYGLVVDEAMACGLPVISTSAAGEIHDRVEEGINGYIVPPEDSVILANRMLTLTQDPVLRARMGQVSAQKIEGHTPEKWAEDFERIVDILLNKCNC